jgi:hypothetical protein
VKSVILIIGKRDRFRPIVGLFSRKYVNSVKYVCLIYVTGRCELNDASNATDVAAVRRALYRRRCNE